jgi:acetyl esterase/lipase
MLIYPWNLYDPKIDGLVDDLTVPNDCPPTFLVHTDDDASSSLGAVEFYRGLKKRRIPAALHVYHNGGHGYGLRAVPGSQISSWTEHAAHWLTAQAAAGR